MQFLHIGRISPFFFTQGSSHDRLPSISTYPPIYRHTYLDGQLFRLALIAYILILTGLAKTRQVAFYLLSLLVPARCDQAEITTSPEHFALCGHVLQPNCGNSLSLYFFGNNMALPALGCFPPSFLVYDDLIFGIFHFLVYSRWILAL